MKEQAAMLSSCIFTDHQVRSKLKQKRKLGKFINELIYHYTQKSNQVSYTFVDDAFLFEMNMKHLQHDTYTDIITFNLSQKKHQEILADIYISADRVADNAKSLGVKYADELLRVIIHGALHLSGFNDNTKSKKQQMRDLEQTWMLAYSS